MNCAAVTHEPRATLVERRFFGNAGSTLRRPNPAPRGSYGSGVVARRCSAGANEEVSMARVVPIRGRTPKPWRDPRGDGSFISRQCCPADTGQTWQAYYALATAHASLGSIAEIGGLYILLAAGTKVLPARFCITEYKLWMRSVVVLWWIALLLGMATYARWYTPHLFR
jgi:hypothetical protein